MSNDPKYNILEEVKIGDTIKATVVKTDDGTGNINYPVKKQKKSFHGCLKSIYG